MRKLFVFLGVVCMTIGSAVSAQEVDSIAPLQKSSWGDAKEGDIAEFIPDISLDTKFGYKQNITDRSGRFSGEGLFLDINGKIGKHFSYSLNHRLASFEGDDISGFDCTNWLLLTFETEKFSISAGKDALFVGSFEYDAYDLDSYEEINSLFWNYGISPWQWGISAAWYPAEGQSLSFQFANSPLSDIETPNMFSYALAWRGEWDFYESYWTVNLWQSDRESYVKALNLGNRFYLGDFTVDVEYMTRATDIRRAFRDDFTVFVQPAYEWDWGRAFAKCGWETIKEDNFGIGVNGGYLFYGAGAEFFPLKKYRDIRIHAVWGANNCFFDDDLAEISSGHSLNIGLTWKLNLTEAGKYLFRRFQK